MLCFALGILIAILIWICLPNTKSQKGFLGFIAALIYFPFGVILALTKKYK